MTAPATESTCKGELKVLVKTLTSTEVCEALRIHPKTLRKWEKEGKIKFAQIGRKHLFLEDDINELIYAAYRKV